MLYSLLIIFLKNDQALLTVISIFFEALLPRSFLYLFDLSNDFEAFTAKLKSEGYQLELCLIVSVNQFCEVPSVLAL